MIPPGPPGFARFPVAGGHTIIDDVPKYGLAVTGMARADAIVRNSTAHPGDLLYLTKPIGPKALRDAVAPFDRTAQARL